MVHLEVLVLLYRSPVPAVAMLVALEVVLLLAQADPLLDVRGSPDCLAIARTLEQRVQGVGLVAKGVHVHGEGVVVHGEALSVSWWGSEPPYTSNVLRMLPVRRDPPAKLLSRCLWLPELDLRHVACGRQGSAGDRW